MFTECETETKFGQWLCELVPPLKPYKPLLREKSQKGWEYKAKDVSSRNNLLTMILRFPFIVQKSDLAKAIDKATQNQENPPRQGVSMISKLQPVK